MVGLKREAFLIAALIVIAVLGFRRKEFVRERVRSYFAEIASPFNTAILRIIVFTALLCRIEFAHIAFMASLPAQLRVAPSYWGPLFDLVPFDSRTVGIAMVVLAVACVLGILGLFLRVAGIVAFVVGVYVIGIPNFFGKIKHTELILLWSALLMAFSNGSDVLGLDGVFKSWRRADSGDTSPPAPSTGYALPIRLAWLMVGLAYFWPGFWKSYSLGPAFFLGPNLRYQLYQSWGPQIGWHASVRPDLLPFGMEIGGLATMVWELSYLFLIFFPRARLPLGGASLVFHNVTYRTMRIGFWPMQAMQFSLVNWSRAFEWLGARLFPIPMVVAYDSHCKLCRRTIGSLRSFDVLGRILWIEAQDEEALAANGLSGVDRVALVTDMHAFLDGKPHPGYEAYKKIAWRIPALWLAAPVMMLPPVAWIGRKIYRRIADSRTCTIRRAPMPAVATGRTDLRPLVASFLFLFAGANFMGFRHEMNSWPFASFPTADHLELPSYTLLRVHYVDAAGRGQNVYPLYTSLNQLIQPDRMYKMEEKIWFAPTIQERASRVQGYWALLQRELPALRGATSAIIYRERKSSLPDDDRRTVYSEEIATIERSPRGRYVAAVVPVAPVPSLQASLGGRRWER